MIRALLTFVAMMAMTGMAYAQQQLQLPGDLLNAPVEGSVASWIIRSFGLLTILSVAPGILIMVTSFPRFVIAFSRNGTAFEDVSWRIADTAARCQSSA